MSQTILSHDTETEGIINDTQFDFYGTRLATCDSLGTVKVCVMENDQVLPQSTAYLLDADIGGATAHLGPVWQVAWSHPKYENVIATSGYDKTIKIWKETYGQWKCIYKQEADSSVNSVQFAPWEYGLHLAAGVADGKVIILSLIQGVWQKSEFQTHDGGVTAISWGPTQQACLLQAETFDFKHNEKVFELIPKRFVTAGMDNKVKIWQENKEQGNFEKVGELVQKGKQSAHEDWVRDVAWCNNVGTQRDLIATCGEDKELKIWINNDQKNQSQWQLAWTQQFGEPVWKCSWSPVGFMLGVSSGDNKTQIFQQQQNYKAASQDQPLELWQLVSEVGETGEIVDSQENQ